MDETIRLYFPWNKRKKINPLLLNSKLFNWNQIQMFGISLLNIYIFEISESNDRNTFQTLANLSKFKLWLLIYRKIKSSPI